jgi:hypothetical protein
MQKRIHTCIYADTRTCDALFKGSTCTMDQISNNEDRVLRYDIGCLDLRNQTRSFGEYDLHDVSRTPRFVSPVIVPHKLLISMDAVRMIAHDLPM